MSVTWTNDLELRFLEYVQGELILWQGKHNDHKNKIKIHDAWSRISIQMTIPIPELKKKELLMSSYRTYKKKVRDSVQSGAGSDEIYKPIWFTHQLIDSFLGEGNKCQNTINTDNPSPLTDNVKKEFSASSLNTDEEQEVGGILNNPQTPEVADAGNMVKDALSTLKSTMSFREFNNNIEDEWDLHGKVIAKKLRQLPENQRTQFVCEIYPICAT